MKKVLYSIIAILVLLSAGLSAFAQEPEVKRSSEKTSFSMSTNLVQWANFGTPNLELGLSVHRNVSLHAGARYNGWKFKDFRKDIPIWNKQQTYYGGLRYWPWYSFSGFWVGFKGQYSKVSSTGIWRPALEEYTGVGVGLSLGYTVMLTPHFNMDFGMGAWGGRYLKYALYDCPTCMEIRDEGARHFGGLDDISISFCYVF